MYFWSKCVSPKRRFCAIFFCGGCLGIFHALTWRVPNKGFFYGTIKQTGLFKLFGSMLMLWNSTNNQPVFWPQLSTKGSMPGSLDYTLLILFLNICLCNYVFRCFMSASNESGLTGFNLLQMMLNVCAWLLMCARSLTFPLRLSMTSVKVPMLKHSWDMMLKTLGPLRLE